MNNNRKFQWIFLIFVISQCVVICQKLNETENLMRLKDCGNEFLPQPSQNENGVNIDYFNVTVRKSFWLSWATQPNGSTVLHFKQSAAFPISNRHMFTSSQVVLTANKTWALDGLPFENCNKTIDYADVPDHILKNLVVSFGGRRVEVLRGRILVCRKDNFDTMYTPLLLETKPLNLPNIPCLADDDSIEFKQDAEVHAYGLEGLIMTHRRVKIDTSTDDKTWVHTFPRYKYADSRGGPLVLDVSGKATVIGLNAAGSDEYTENYYYNMVVLQDKICEYSGVCFVKNVTEALAKLSATVAPVTKPPEDVGHLQNTPNRAGNNETPERQSPDAHEPKEWKRPTYSEGVEPEESESDDDEEDTDILLSKDFFSLGTRLGQLELSLVFLVVVILL
ncbi:hypothetical protein CRE_30381 [Caenorhabditis remanei]|uniref:Uncharacterized protein n=1 Tax=Caenorhabditis remanei TaxID=31234 RepID=E3N5Z5_CAERE|nr:hypothetical protein CRE_30381 [Caenorhabditis remanei]